MTSNYTKLEKRKLYLTYLIFNVYKKKLIVLAIKFVRVQILNPCRNNNSIELSLYGKEHDIHQQDGRKLLHSFHRHF